MKKSILFFCLILTVPFLDTDAFAKKKMTRPTELAVYHNNRGIRYLDAGDLNLAEEELKTAVELCPDYIEAYNNLGIVEKKKGNLVAAKAYFQKAIQLDPKYGVAISHLSTTYLDEGNFEKALEYGELAKKRNPTSPMVHYNLALVYIEKSKKDTKKDYSQFAEKELQTSTELDPGMFEAHRTLARLYRTQGKYDQAIIRYRLAVETHPTDPVMWTELGETLLAKGDSAKAENAFRKALTLSEETQVNTVDPHMDLGLKYMAQKDYSQAIDEFKLAVQSNPTNEITHYRLGTAYLSLGEQLVSKNRNEEAKEFFNAVELPLRTALQLNPQMVDASYNLGLAYYDLGNYSAAEAEWLRTLQIYSEHQRALYNLGMLYQKQNMSDKSAEYLCRFYKIAGDEFSGQKKSSLEIIKASGKKCQN